MPIYQYECRKCSHQFEQQQSFSDKELSDCPECNKPELFRVVSGGLGFYCSNRTLGALAENNADKSSADLKEALKKKHKVKKVKSKLPEHLRQPVDKPKGPALPKLNDGVSDAQLKAATPGAIKNYIEKGKLID